MEKESRFCYEKDVTRDLALLVVEGFGPVAANLYKKLKGTDSVVPFIIFYIKDFLVEEWLNRDFLKELTELIYLENLKNPNFLEKGIANYKKHSDTYQNSNITSLEELRKYFHSLHLSLESFLIFYLTAGDDRTPKVILERAKKVRDADTLGDTADKIVRTALLNIFSYTEGYETVVSSEDLANMPTLDILKERTKQFLFIGGSPYPAPLGRGSLEESLKTLGFQVQSRHGRHPRSPLRLHHPLPHRLSGEVPQSVT